MDRQEATAVLEMLVERATALEQTIQDMDDQIERAMHAVAGGTNDVGHAMGVLTELRNDQLGRMFDLGKTRAQIEDMENRMREWGDRAQEYVAVDQWQEHSPVAENHLDWLKPVLEAPEPEHLQDDRYPHYDGEERMLAEMHREEEREDYLDWWKR